MKLSLYLLIFGISFFPITMSRGGVEPDQAFRSQVLDVLKECKNVTPGRTRADLLKVFTVQGGISTRTHETYAYRSCPYIQVDVEFVVSGSENTTSDHMKQPTDVISKISRPYLEYAIVD